MAHAALWPALSLLAGILVGILIRPPAVWLAGVVVACLAAGVAAILRRSAGGVLLSVMAGFAVGGASLGADAERLARDPPLARLVDTAAPEGVAVLEGTLRADAADAASGIALWIDADRLELDGRVHEVAGGAVMTVAGTLAAVRRDAWRAGRRVRVTGQLRLPTRYRNAGVPDHRLSLARRGTVVSGSVKSGALVSVLSAGDRAAEAAAAVRAFVRRAAHATVGQWSSRSAALVVAILIGDRAGLSEDLEERLQEAGTYHVIAVSGGNVAVLAACALTLSWMVGLRGRLGLWLVVAALAGYAGIAEGGSSVTRATLMAVVYLAARAIDQRGSPASVMAIAASVILAAAPLAICDPGLLLTFGASVGIVTVVPRVVSAWRGPRWLRPLVALWAASLAAELVVMPLGATFFSRVTVAGLVLNFAAVPLMAVVQVAGMVAVGAFAIAPALSAAAAPIAHAAAEGLVGSADLVTFAPWASWRVPAPPLPVVAAYYATLALLLSTARWLPGIVPWHRAARRAVTLAFALAALALATAPAWPRAPWNGPAPLRITFLDVGQGDATLIQLPDGHAWLVDAGGLPGPTRFDIGERVVAPAAWAAGVRRLDALLVTHAHPDHAGGARAVAEALRPREIWEGVPVPPEPALRELFAAAASKKIGWRQVQAGDRLQRGGVTLTVWSPPLPDWERQRVRNDDSIVVEVRYGDVSIVLPGDVGAAVERVMAARAEPAALCVLKAAHHGSETSSSREFLDTLRPAAVVVSCGRRNRFGHPGARVLERFAERAIPVFRTDEDGAVTLETDGRSVHMRTWTGRELILPAATAARARPEPGRLTLTDCVRAWAERTQNLR